MAGQPIITSYALYAVEMLWKCCVVLLHMYFILAPLDPCPTHLYRVRFHRRMHHQLFNQSSMDQKKGSRKTNDFGFGVQRPRQRNADREYAPGQRTAAAGPLGLGQRDRERRRAAWLRTGSNAPLKVANGPDEFALSLRRGCHTVYRSALTGSTPSTQHAKVARSGQIHASPFVPIRPHGHAHRTRVSRSSASVQGPA